MSGYQNNRWRDKLLAGQEPPGHILLRRLRASCVETGNIWVLCQCLWVWSVSLRMKTLSSKRLPRPRPQSQPPVSQWEVAVVERSNCQPDSENDFMNTCWDSENDFRTLNARRWWKSSIACYEIFLHEDWIIFALSTEEWKHGAKLKLCSISFKCISAGYMNDNNVLVNILQYLGTVFFTPWEFGVHANILYYNLVELQSYLIVELSRNFLNLRKINVF